MYAERWDTCVHVLAKLAHRVVSREELVRLVWPTGQPIKRQTLDVYLFSLRAKIEEQPACPARLLTARGVGYRLVAAETTRAAETD